MMMMMLMMMMMTTMTTMRVTILVVLVIIVKMMMVVQSWTYDKLQYLIYFLMLYVNNVMRKFPENPLLICFFFSVSYLVNKVLSFIVQQECFLDGLLMIRE